MTRLEQEVIELLHEAQETFGNVSNFAAVMADHHCARCGQGLTVGGGRPALQHLSSFSSVTLNLAARAGAVLAGLQAEIGAREQEGVRMLAELQVMRTELASIRGASALAALDARFRDVSVAARRVTETPAETTQDVEAQLRRANRLATHDFQGPSGFCVRCKDGQGTMRNCPGASGGSVAEGKDRFTLIELD